jgi:transcriptional regulator with XRE-family HTH domain
MKSVSSETQKIGIRIAEARHAKGLTQAQLAELIGISRLLLSDYERGKVRIYADVVAKIATALGISPAKLLIIQEANYDPGPSLRLVKRLKKIEKLPESKQKALLTTIDGFLNSHEAASN